MKFPHKTTTNGYSQDINVVLDVLDNPFDYKFHGSFSKYASEWYWSQLINIKRNYPVIGTNLEDFHLSVLYKTTDVKTIGKRIHYSRSLAPHTKIIKMSNWNYVYLLCFYLYNGIIKPVTLVRIALDHGISDGMHGKSRGDNERPASTRSSLCKLSTVNLYKHDN